MKGLSAAKVVSDHFPWMQATAAAEKLNGFKFGKVFISPFLRCVHKLIPVLTEVLTYSCQPTLDEMLLLLQNYADCSQLL